MSILSSIRLLQPTRKAIKFSVQHNHNQANNILQTQVEKEKALLSNNQRAVDDDDFARELCEHENVQRHYNDVFSKLPPEEKAKIEKDCEALDRYETSGGANILRLISCKK